MPVLTVGPIAWRDPQAVALRREMYDDLAAVYPAETAAVEASGGFPALDGRAGVGVLASALARVDGEPAGFAALRLVDAQLDTLPSPAGELRKVFVRPRYRGRGVAEALVAAIEATAAEAGLRSLVLETGVVQTAAVRLYTRLGYGPIAAFPPHEADPSSVFLGKALVGVRDRFPTP